MYLMWVGVDYTVYLDSIERAFRLADSQICSGIQSGSRTGWRLAACPEDLKFDKLFLRLPFVLQCDSLRDFLSDVRDL